MRISIITVCFNSAETIRDTLNSIRAQTHRDIEYIVIDGGSTDGTVQLVEHNRDIVNVFVSEPDRGIYDAMNKGIARATGELTGCLNSDDMYADSESLSRIAFAAETTDSKVVYGDLSYVRRNQPDQRVRIWKSAPFRPGMFAQGWAPPHPTFYASTEALQRIGGFDDSYRLAADFDLMLRILEVEKLRSTYIEGDLVHMRVGGASGGSVKSIYQQNLDIIRSLRAHGLPVSPARFVARKVLSRIQQRIAASTNRTSKTAQPVL